MIAALHDSKVFSEKHPDASYEGQEISEEQDRDLRGNAYAAHLEIEKAADIGAFILSGQTLERLRQFLNESLRAKETRMWQEYLENDLAITAPCLEEVIQLAKKDLGTK